MFVLGIALAQASPPPRVADDLLRSFGPYTMVYVGEYVAESDAGYDDPTECPAHDDAVAREFQGRMTLRDGSMWEVIGVDLDEVAALVDHYDALTASAPRLDESDPNEWGDPEAEAMSFCVNDHYIANCTGSSKWVFLGGTQTDIFAAPSSERRAILDGQDIAGSFVLVRPDLVLTTAHTVWNPASPVVPDGVCMPWTVGTTLCREILAVFENVTSGYNCNNDWELMLIEPFPDHVAYPTFDLANGSDSYLLGEDPKLGGYPTIAMGGETTCTAASGMQGEINEGDWYYIQTQHVALKVTSGGNMSGGPYYFYNATQGRYKAFGLHHGRENDDGCRYSCGPKIPYWRSSIIAAAGALGTDW